METLLNGDREREYFTDLRLVFAAIEDRQREFNWLITDLDYTRFQRQQVQADKPMPFSGLVRHQL